MARMSGQDTEWPLVHLHGSICMSDLQIRREIPQLALLNQWQATLVWPDVIAQMGRILHTSTRWPEQVWWCEHLNSFQNHPIYSSQSGFVSKAAPRSFFGVFCSVCYGCCKTAEWTAKYSSHSKSLLLKNSDSLCVSYRVIICTILMGQYTAGKLHC